MNKNKGPKSPWAFGKGKPLTQKLPLEGFSLNSIPDSLAGNAYPSTIFQDELALKYANAAQPAQGVISDMLPVPYQGAPRVYPQEIYQDDAFKARPGKQWVLGGNDYLPAVVKNADEAIPAASNVIDDVFKPLARQGVKTGTKVAASAVSALPGVGDILMPEYANAGEGGMDWRNEIARRDQHKIASDQELAAMLGIKAPNNYVVAPEMTGGRSIAGGNANLPSGGESQITSTPSPNNQSNQAQAGQKASSGGRFTNASMNAGDDNNTPPVDPYRAMLNDQMDAYRNVMKDRSTLSYLDMSPLTGLVDQLTGSNLSQSYKGAPASAERDMAKVSGLGKMMADYDLDKEKIRVAELNALKNTADERLRNSMQLAAYKASLNQNGQGQYGLKPKDVVQIKQNFNKQTEGVKAYLDFNDKLNTYLDAINGVDGAVLTGAKRDAIESAYKDMSLAYKEAVRLGALTGPDLDLMEGVNKPVYGWKGAVNDYVGGGVQSARDSAKRLKEQSKKRVSDELENLIATYSTVPGVVDDQINLYKSRLDKMDVKEETYRGRSPTTNVSNRVENKNLGKPKTITQGQFTYTLNEATGEYE